MYRVADDDAIDRRGLGVGRHARERDFAFSVIVAAACGDYGNGCNEGDKGGRGDPAAAAKPEATSGQFSEPMRSQQ